MIAIILAGGYGERLLPLTANLPKALIEINGKPLLSHICQKLMEIQDIITSIIIVSNGKFYEQFRCWAKSQPEFCCLNITIISDYTMTSDTRLGAVGDLCVAIERLGVNDDIYVTASDCFFTFSLRDYYTFFRKCVANCVAIQEYDDIEQLSAGACVEINKEGCIIRFKEKPKVPFSNLAAYPMYFYLKETLPIIQSLNKRERIDSPGRLIELLHLKKPVFAYKFIGECIDIGIRK